MGSILLFTSTLYFLKESLKQKKLVNTWGMCEWMNERMKKPIEGGGLREEGSCYTGRP